MYRLYYMNFKGNTLNFKFQYISCIGYTINKFADFASENPFQYISCIGYTYQVRELSQFLYIFQYISCIGYTARLGLRKQRYGDFNTSHVSVILLLSSFFTSPFVISIHLMYRLYKDL